MAVAVLDATACHPGLRATRRRARAMIASQLVGVARNVLESPSLFVYLPIHTHIICLLCKRMNKLDSEICFLVKFEIFI